MTQPNHPISHDKPETGRSTGSLRTGPGRTGFGRTGLGLRAAVIGIAAVGLTGAGLVAFAGSAESVQPKFGIELATAEIRSFSITTLANGELEAKNQLEIRNRVEARTTIVEIVPEGIDVKQGDVLIRLADDSLRNRIAEEELAVIEERTNLENAQAAEKIQISENDSKVRAAESKLSIALLTYDQWEKGDVVRQRQDNELAVDRTRKNLVRLESKYKNSKDLFLKEFLSKDELDRDEIAYIEAEAAVKTAELSKRVYEEFQFHKDAEQRRRDVEEATAELGRTREENDINLRAKQTQTVNRSRQLTLREEKLTELRQQLEFCTVVAPQSGLVVYGSSISDNWRWQNEGGLSVGREVSNNDLLIALPDTSEMTASVKVHESLAGRVRPGQAVAVKVDAIDATIPGVVASIGVLAESGGWRDPNRREYTVKIDLNTDVARSAGLKPTLRCEARIELGRVDNALTVPVQAVFNENSVRYALRPLPTGRFERVPVMLGRTSDTNAEIVAGLSEGDRVLIRVPLPGEVENATSWDADRLTAAGYTLDENGKPTIDRAAMARARATRGPTGERPSAAPAEPGASTDEAVVTKTDEAVVTETNAAVPDAGGPGENAARPSRQGGRRPAASGG